MKNFVSMLKLSPVLLLFLTVGCSDSGGPATPVMPPAGDASARPEMQMEATEAQVDRGVQMDLDVQSRREPPQ